MLSFAEFQEILCLPTPKSTTKLQKSDTQFSLILKESVQSKFSQKRLEIEGQQTDLRINPKKITNDADGKNTCPGLEAANTEVRSANLSRKYKNGKSKSKSGQRTGNRGDKENRGNGTRSAKVDGKG